MDALDHQQHVDYLNNLFAQQLQLLGEQDKPKCYTIEEVNDLLRRGNAIGSGAMSTVYRSIIEGVEVAIKQAKCQGPTLNDDAMYISFLIERCALMFEHPNIIRLIGYCENPRSPTLILEYVPQDVLSERPRLTFSHVLRILLSAAKALRANHCNDPVILHRDVKPENMLCDFDDQQNVIKEKMIDYGLARVGIAGHHLFGTPLYMDPVPDASVVPGVHSPGRPSSDIYSWSRMAQQLMTKDSSMELIRLGDELVDKNSVKEIYNQLAKNKPMEGKNPLRRRSPKNVIRKNILKSQCYSENLCCAFFALLARCQSENVVERPTAEALVTEMESLVSQL